VQLQQLQQLLLLLQLLEAWQQLQMLPNRSQQQPSPAALHQHRALQKPQLQQHLAVQHSQNTRPCCLKQLTALCSSPEGAR
jgi:hypothetical protein